MNTLILNFTVKTQSISFVDRRQVVADSKQYLYVAFKFITKWTGSIYALFYDSKGLASIPIEKPLDKNKGVFVPPELIKTPFFYVSLYCLDINSAELNLEQRITTGLQQVAVAASGYSDDSVPPLPPPDMYEYVSTPADETGMKQIKQIDGAVKYSNDGGMTWNDTAGGESGNGTSGELWLPSVDTDGNLSWERSATTEPPETQNIKGKDGTDGDDGENGSRWHKGAVTPNPSIGDVNDWYINTDTYDVYNKTSETTWTFQVNIKGVAGVDGVSAFTSAQTGGYTGDEIQFYSDLAGVQNLNDALTVILGV
ncbi:MAG: hypothetical protein FWD71_01310 [Oscillospiraceae bacterium]|nr:hypothetical protein [Oscillospiraceae bacterium]